jgi:GTPase SAR1 family protein
MAFHPHSDADETFDYLFKIVLIGDADVGKTCVVQRFKSGTYVEKHASTIGVDFTMKTLQIDGKLVKVCKTETQTKSFVSPSSLIGHRVRNMWESKMFTYGRYSHMYDYGPSQLLSRSNMKLGKAYEQGSRLKIVYFSISTVSFGISCTASVFIGFA